MLFIDTETTGLLKPDATNLNQQPKITEICIIKTDDELNVIEEFTSFVNPNEKLDEIIIKLTGITDSMLVNQPQFIEVYSKLCEMFLGETTIVAHNAPFDMGMLYVELARQGLEYKFPWPQKWICTMEKSKHIESKHLKLTDLHELATGRPHEDKAHRATEDVLALIRCYNWLSNEGHL